MVIIRLLIKLESVSDSVYDPEYYHKLQGFIYNVLKKTHSPLHDKKGYKFFCYSNIFPIGDMKEGSRRHLIISSPDKTIIKALYSNIPETAEIGYMKFNVIDRKKLIVKINENQYLITSTPVITRIPRIRYTEYDIESPHEYTYWRHQHPIKAFLKQLEENIHKKYKDYYNEEVHTPLIFEEIQPLKNPAVYVQLDGKKTQLIGSTWKFHIKKPTTDQKKLLKFGIETGLGELNTLGFGFTNPQKTK